MKHGHSIVFLGKGHTAKSAIMGQNEKKQKQARVFGLVRGRKKLLAMMAHNLANVDKAIDNLLTKVGTKARMTLGKTLGPIANRPSVSRDLEGNAGLLKLCPKKRHWCHAWVNSICF